MERKINFYFDDEDDVLDISFGKPRKAVSKELKNDIAIRVDPKTGEVVGITVLNFTKRFRLTRKREEIELPIKITVHAE